MAERDVAKVLLEGVEKLRGHYRRVRWLGRKGAPDLYLLLPMEVLPGRHDVWVETKAPRGVLNPHQRREIALMRGFGIPVLVIRTIDEADELIGLLAANRHVN